MSKTPNAAAQALGKMRAKKIGQARVVEIASLGGAARAANMTPAKRRRIAKKASKAAAVARKLRAKENSSSA